MRVRSSIWVLFVVSILFAGTARANFACGIQPILPIGCDSALCICDDDGNCEWVYVCN